VTNPFLSKADQPYPAAGMKPTARAHINRLLVARDDPWDKYGGRLSTAIVNAHHGGMEHEAIAHYSGKPLSSVKLIVHHLGGVAKAASLSKSVFGVEHPGKDIS
jgi:hypothetical protein